MAKPIVDYIVDAGMGISFLAVAVTGILKFPGLIQTLGMSYSSLPFGEISTVHDWSGIVMAVLVLIHLVLHRKWIYAMTKSILKGKKCEAE